MTQPLSPETDTLLERLRDFVEAESKRWTNFSTGDLHSIEVSPAGKLVQEAIEALNHPPALAEAMQPFIDALESVDEGMGMRLRCDDETPIGAAIWDNEQPTIGDLRQLFAAWKAVGAPAQCAPGHDIAKRVVEFIDMHDPFGDTFCAYDVNRIETALSAACEPCEYCGPGVRTGLPGNACENCMNTGLKYPALTTERDSPVMGAAKRAAKVSDGWSDAKRDYADRVTSTLCSCKASGRDGQHMAWCPALSRPDGGDAT